MSREDLQTRGDDAGLTQRLKALEEANRARDERLNLILDIATQAKQNFQEVDQSLAGAQTMEARAKLLEDRAKAADKYFRDLLAAENDTDRTQSPSRSYVSSPSGVARPSRTLHDSVNSTWKTKADNLTHELQVLQRELRRHLNELRGELDESDPQALPQQYSPARSRAVAPSQQPQQQPPRSLQQSVPPPPLESGSPPPPSRAAVAPSPSSMERPVIELHGDRVEGSLLHVRVVSGPGDRTRYGFQWARLGAESGMALDCQSPEYQLTAADVGFVIEAAAIPCDSQGNQIADAAVAHTEPVRGAVPAFHNATIAGATLCTTRFAFDAQYTGGPPGQHVFQWLKSADGLTWRLVGHAKSGLYQATSEDINGYLRVVAVPVGASGQRGAEVSVTTEKIRVDPGLQADVQDFAERGVAEFRVRVKTLIGRNLSDADGTLAFGKGAVSVTPDGDKPVTQLFNRETHVLLHPADPSLFKLQLRVGADAVLSALPPTARQRDLIALTAFYFANQPQAGRSPTAARAKRESPQKSGPAGGREDEERDEEHDEERDEERDDAYGEAARRKHHHHHHHMTEEEKRARIEQKRAQFATEEEWIAWKRAEKERRKAADPVAYAEKKRRQKEMKRSAEHIEREDGDEHRHASGEGGDAEIEAAGEEQYQAQADDAPFEDRATESEHRLRSGKEVDTGVEEGDVEDPRPKRNLERGRERTVETDDPAAQPAPAPEGAAESPRRRSKKSRSIKDVLVEGEVAEGDARRPRRSRKPADVDAAPDDRHEAGEPKHKRRSRKPRGEEGEHTDAQIVLAETEAEGHRRHHGHAGAETMQVAVEVEIPPEGLRHRRRHDPVEKEVVVEVPVNDGRRKKHRRHGDDSQEVMVEVPFEAAEDGRRKRKHSRKEAESQPQAPAEAGGTRKHRHHSHKEEATSPETEAGVVPEDDASKHKQKRRSHKDRTEAFGDGTPVEESMGKRKRKHRSHKEEILLADGETPDVEAGGMRKHRHRSQKEETTEPHNQSEQAVAGESGTRKRKHRSKKDGDDEGGPPQADEENAVKESTKRKTHHSHKEDIEDVLAADEEPLQQERKKLSKEELKASMTPDEWRAWKKKKVEDKRKELSPTEFDEWMRKHKAPSKTKGDDASQ